MMKRYGYAALAMVAILLVTFVAGSWFGRRGGGNTAESRRILHYVDPMNPAHTSPEPGLAPCGMKMEPVYADEEGQSSNIAMTPGMVKINPAKQQLIGVRTIKVEKAPWTYNLRALGRVVVDENRIYRLQAATDGQVRQVYPYTTGSLVQKGAALATFSNNDLYQDQVNHINNLINIELLKKGSSFPYASSQSTSFYQYNASSIQLAERSLKNLENKGMGKGQIGEITRTRQPILDVALEAPATSFVLARNVTPGLKFDKGAEFYRLADLSHVWIVADLFDKEVQYLKPQDQAQVFLSKQQQDFQAKVSEVLPLVDPATRVFKVRLEADNPDYALKPDMFVDVNLPISLPPAITVPVDAVLDSGLTQTVFVERGNGFFEPRKVKTGQRLSDRVEIIQGIEPGENIVVSGNFLIDSESRMKLAAAGLCGTIAKDVVCQMDVGETTAKAAGRFIEYQGKTYFFCTGQCKQIFDKEPARYASQTPVVQPKQDAPTEVKQQEAKPAGIPKDPVCSMPVEEAKAKAAGLVSAYQDKTIFFCTEACKQQFDKEPQRYMSQGSETQKAESPKPEAMPAHGAHQPPAAGNPKESAPPAEATVETGPAKDPMHGAGGQPAAMISHKSSCPAGDRGETGKAKDPFCGESVDQALARAAGRFSEYQGKVFYFDSEVCKMLFDSDPAKHAAGPETPKVSSPTPEVREQASRFRSRFVQDPVSGKSIDKNSAGSQGLQKEYQGTFYYFENNETKKRFEEAPSQYATPKSPMGRKTPVIPSSPLAPKEPQAASPGWSMDPVTCNLVEESMAKAVGLVSEYQGKHYYFETISGKKDFEAEPQRYLSQAAAPAKEESAKPEGGKELQSLPEGMAMDPVCGKVVDKAKAKAAGLTRLDMGTTYYFDSEECMRTFSKDTQKSSGKETDPAKAAASPAETKKPKPPQTAAPLAQPAFKAKAPSGKEAGVVAPPAEAEKPKPPRTAAPLAQPLPKAKASGDKEAGK